MSEPQRPLTPEEYARQMAEYEQQMKEYQVQKAMYDRLYGNPQASTANTPQGLPQGQVPQQQQVSQGYQVPQQPGQKVPQGYQVPQQPGQQGQPPQGQPPPNPLKKSVKGMLKWSTIKKFLPIVFLVLIAIGVVGTLLGGKSSTPPPSSSSKPKPSSSSHAPISSSSESSTPEPGGVDKDKASIDRVPTPGNTESMGNLMELYNEIVFPSVLSVPEPEPVVDKTTVNLGGSYVFRPNKNWSSRIDGNSITLVHDEGIVAKFIFNKNKRTLKPDQMKAEVFPAFLKGFGITEPVYDEIFYNTTLSGVSTRVNARFNDEPLILEIGMVTCNREVLTYVIAYYDTSEVFQSEIVESLLNTITWKSSPVTFSR